MAGSRGKGKGTAAERLVVGYLQSTYWPHAERRALAGSLDKGDVTGTPGLVWEVKAAKTLCVPQWLRETEIERVNAKADYGTLVVKPSGIGEKNVGQFYAFMGKSKFNEIPWSAAPNAHTFSTTVRKIKFDVAIDLARLNAACYGRPAFWINYPDYVLTTLAQMAKILASAGYGTIAENQE